jgi:hypothetical protein
VPDAGSAEKKVDLMTLAVGMVSTETHQFADIREITELAAEDRRRGGTGTASSDNKPDTDSQILTAW